MRGIAAASRTGIAGVASIGARDACATRVVGAGLRRVAGVRALRRRDGPVDGGGDRRLARDLFDADIGRAGDASEEGGDLMASEGGEGSEADPLYDQAVEIVVKTRRPSISLVQRHLRIGYNRAARLIEQMERSGLVTPMGANGNREVVSPPREGE